MIRTMKGATAKPRPPLWLAAGAVASGWAAVYSIGRWIAYFVQHPIHEDVRLIYVAAEAGTRYGWSTIYDEGTLRTLSSSFPADDRTIDSVLTYLHPPLLAWIFAPLTVFPEPVAYVLWTAISVAALVFAWHLAAPYHGLAKLTLLLVAIGLWPVMQAFYYGQPTFLVIALVAVAWWLIRRDQMLAAGIALALATALKPQVVFMIPICLLVAGRFKAVVGWAGACAVLAALSAVALGPAGLASYWEALRLGQADVGHTFFTVAYLFGLHLGPATYAVLAVQGIACLYVAWSRREDLDIVFAAGLLGTLMVSIHLHQPDYSNLVLAAWLVLRGTPSLAHRLWFGVGIVTMQVLTLGQPVPQLLWDAGWLTILGVGGIKPRRESLSHDRSAEPAAEPVV
ncbi:MAG: DUF2029 domain-containing protein [Chloroflexi bacterium]|nr:MAG: DUF2029 domain-containing protein [Chloroflexota bacterium]